MTNYPTLLMLVVAAALFVSGCRADPPAFEPQRLRIGLISGEDYLPLFIASEQGFDRKHGLRLIFEKKPYAGGAAVIRSIAAGFIDVGIAGTVPIISAAAQSIVPDRVVPVAANNFADPEHPAGAVLAGADVATWKQLTGKLIAINAADSILGVAIKRRLANEGVTDYKLVEMSLPNMGLAVMGGNVSAAAMYEPYITQSLLRGDGKLLDWIIGGPPFVRMQSTLLVVSGNVYRNDRRVVKALVKAHMEAVEWLNAHAGQARLLLSKWLDLNQQVAGQVKLLKWVADLRNSAESLEEMQSAMEQIGLLNKRIAINRLYDETVLDELSSRRR